MTLTQEEKEELKNTWNDFRRYHNSTESGIIICMHSGCQFHGMKEENWWPSQIDTIIEKKLKEEREEIIKELHGISCRCLCERTKCLNKYIDLINSRNK